MIRLIPLFLLFVISFSAFAQIRENKNIEKSKVYKPERNLTLEKQSTLRYNSITPLLSPTAKVKLDEITRQLLNSMVKENSKLNIDSFLSKNINRRFPEITEKQRDLLKFYVLKKAENMISNNDLESIGELSEMTSLRLQMTMDRRSKFISTLSNIMKKISTTQDTLVQNLK